jgi:hypothetical protein
MTRDSRVSFRPSGDGGEPRLQLQPTARASTHLDGAWWPWSSQLAIELPTLVEDLSERLGLVAVVGYHHNARTQTPQEMQIADETVQLQGFSSDQPATVILIGRDGRRVTLRVIPPDANPTTARQELDAASEQLDDAVSTDDQAEQVTARSVTEVAAQLARHQSHGDRERPAEIARWCQAAAQQFVSMPIQAFVPILVHHIVRNRMAAAQPATRRSSL